MALQAGADVNHKDKAEEQESKPFRISDHPHVLNYSDDLGGHTCDLCHESIEDNGYRCGRGCDFDMCIKCAEEEEARRNKQSQTLLMSASALGLTSTVAKLLALGADIAAKDAVLDNVCFSLFQFFFSLFQVFFPSSSFFFPLPSPISQRFFFFGMFYMYVCMCVCIYDCIHVCVAIHVCMHTHVCKVDR